MAALAGKNNSISAANVAFGDGLRTRGAEQVHGICVAGSARQHQRRLVVLVQGNAIAFVVQREQDFDDGDEAKGGGEVERGVGEAGRGEVRVVQEVGV
jgi:hypothetical protein